MPNSSKRADGYYTVGMQDFSYQVPDNRLVSCSASCGDTTYPTAIPLPDPLQTISPS